MPMSGMPPMSGMEMFFNGRSDDVYLLFKGWYPKTPAAFAISCVVVVVAAMCEGE